MTSAHRSARREVVVNGDNGRILSEKNEVYERKQQYFEGLLKLKEERSADTESDRNITDRSNTTT